MWAHSASCAPHCSAGSPSKCKLHAHSGPKMQPLLDSSLSSLRSSLSYLVCWDCLTNKLLELRSMSQGLLLGNLKLRWRKPMISTSRALWSVRHSPKGNRVLAGQVNRGPQYLKPFFRVPATKDLLLPSQHSELGGTISLPRSLWSLLSCSGILGSYTNGCRKLVSTLPSRSQAHWVESGQTAQPQESSSKSILQVPFKIII